MRLEPHICPVCWAMQNPATGHCLVCGEKYNILDVPITFPSEEKPSAHFLVPFHNGFITFYATADLDVHQDGITTSPEIKFVSHNHAQLVFDFIPDSDTGAIFNVYSGYDTLTD